MIDKELREAIKELDFHVEFTHDKDELLIGYDITEQQLLYKLEGELGV